MLKTTYKCKRFLHGFRLTAGRMFGYDQPRYTYRPTELFVDGSFVEYKSVSVGRYSGMTGNVLVGRWANPWLDVSPVRNNASIDMARPVPVGGCVRDDAYLCCDTGGTGWYVARGHRFGLDFTRPHTDLFRTSKGNHCYTSVPVTDRGRIARGRLEVHLSYDYSPATSFLATAHPSGGVYVVYPDHREPGRYTVHVPGRSGRLVESGRLTAPEARYRPRTITTSPDGNRLAVLWEVPHYSGTGPVASNVALYHLPSFTEQRVIEVPLGVMTFSPDGLTLWGIEGGWNVNYGHRTLYGIDLD